MNAIKNKVQLIGNLGQPPDIRLFGEGRKMAIIRIAINETFKDADGEKKTDTQWHNIIAWGKLAEIAEKHLQKGTEIAIEGRLLSKSFVDKNGVKHHTTEVQATELLILSKKT
ncbi:single-stranded DNA-binding protein [Sediminibacterium ginsengisoli]|uniref:Single-stranded DNA-binding protein n=1 Tax=Sediminibacterium ginsengisoli TaxID=413434 RepID=A0A1T4LYT9_9BACT|nr:single-stranded DNA-binding protein [Sediminibacterium ginsengisoli]SJZ59801.1 single-strand binding protein [Sediminibacterium ginsengisoli]